MIAADIIIDFQGFMQQHGHKPAEWYVGIAADAEHHLFEHHKVNRTFDSWIYRVADNSEIARVVHETCLKWKCQGQSYPGDFRGVAVYAYLRSNNTRP